MDKGRFSWVYAFFKGLVKFGLNRFYQIRQVHGYDEVPKNVAVMFTPNHQNALIDALNAACGTKLERQPTFLTRADVFVSWAMPVLNAYKMLPVYRQRDGVDTLAKNEAIFEECIQRLMHNESLIIFVEGNHAKEFRLRPLKKGAGRIAFQAFERSKEQLDLHFVPVGLNYSNHQKVRNEVLINYGPAFPISDFLESYKQNPRKGLLKATKAIQASLAEQIIHIENTSHYETINGLRLVFSKALAKANGDSPTDLRARFLIEKKVVAQLENEVKAGGEAMEQFHQDAAAYFAWLEEENLRDHVIASGKYPVGTLLLQGIGFLLGLPVYLFGLLNNYHAYRLADHLAVSNFKDLQFHSSIRMVTALLLFPIFYLLQTGLVWIFTNWWIALAYLVALPITGNFAFWLAQKFKKWRARWRFRSMLNKQDAQALHMAESRKQIFSKLLGMLEPKMEKVGS
ncbi:MAG: 1-acyl-sn-glycerol-3-phosphate acyltransferase [Bacteroidota bacterium]